MVILFSLVYHYSYFNFIVFNIFCIALSQKIFVHFSDSLFLAPHLHKFCSGAGYALFWCYWGQIWMRFDANLAKKNKWATLAPKHKAKLSLRHANFTLPSINFNVKGNITPNTICYSIFLFLNWKLTINKDKSCPKEWKSVLHFCRIRF